MEINLKKVDDIDILEITGKLDVTGSQKAHDIIIPAIPKNGKLIVDMSCCDYVASSGLRILLIIAKQSAAAECKTVLAGIQPLVWDVIVMTGFEDMFETFPAQEAAVKALNGE
jgi:anti-anti-sigma factor